MVSGSARNSSIPRGTFTAPLALPSFNSAGSRTPAAANEGDAEAARAAVAELATLLPEAPAGEGGQRGQAGGGVAAQLPGTHWLRLDAHAAMLGAARVLDEPGLIARSALSLLQAREAALVLLPRRSS